MAGIEFDKATRGDLAHMLRDYLKRECDAEIGGMDAEFLLDFITAKLGPRFYNQGLRDAAVALAKRMDVPTEVLEELERPEPRD